MQVLGLGCLWGGAGGNISALDPGGQSVAGRLFAFLITA